MKTISLQSTVGWAVAGFASLCRAQVTFSPGPSYSIGIPSGSSISSSSTGPLYFQLSAATSYQWVALGIGEQMSGSTIFVMYQDGNGNVTISGRKASGQSEPKMDSAIQGGLELLEGSGVSGGNMIANVKCTTCTLQSDATSSSSPWIAAWNTGSSLDSTSATASLRQHANQNTRQVSIDLSRASVASDSNPFISGSGSSTPDATSTDSSGSSPTSTSSRPSFRPDGPFGPGNGYGPGNGFGPGSSDDDNGDDGANGSSSGTSGGITFAGANFQAITDYQKAHGIIMGVVVVLLFPFGAMFMRMGGSGIIHGVLQVLSLVALLVGLGLGVRLADMRHMMFNNTHTVFGIVIVALFLIQPIFGIIHHIQYKRNLARAGVSHLHIWYGRILLVLGVVNGGLGLKLARNSPNGEIAYGVVAGVVGLAYIAMCIFKRKGAAQPIWRKEEVAPPQYSTRPAPQHYGQRNGGNAIFK